MESPVVESEKSLILQSSPFAMVLPSQVDDAIISMDQQERKLLKLTKKKSINNCKIDEMRAAVLVAAVSASKSILESGESNCRMRNYSDLSKDDVSVISHELAIERGSVRGFQERNESERNGLTSQHSSREEYGLTSITEEVTTIDSKAAREKTKARPFWRNIIPFRYKRKRKRTQSSARKISNILLGSDDTPSRTKELSRDAWMCGCCGKLFATYETADIHEEQCIFEQIGKLGYLQDFASHISQAETEEEVDLNVFKISEVSPKTQSSSELGVKLSVGFDFGTSAGIVGDTKRPLHVGHPKHEESKGPQRSILRQSAPSRPTDGNKKEVVNFQIPFSNGVSPTHQLDQAEKGPAQLSEKLPPRKSRASSGTFSDPGCPLSPTTMNAVNATLEVKKVRTKPFSRRKRKPVVTSPFNDNLLITHTMRDYIVMTDEALVNAVQRATAHILTKEELDAEKALRCLSGDKAYYDMMVERNQQRNVNPAERFRSEGQGILSKVQNKFIDAYQLIKEGDQETGPKDQYNRKGKGNEGQQDISHDDNTLYVNVMVKHSVTVVNSELERMAKQRWADTRQLSAEENSKINKFERFRAMAHGNFVKLAGLALASDFTPRKVAVQLSNELYRLMVPQLKRRGVTIETEIEYRVGPYFILAVNVKNIDWQKLIKFTHRDVRRRRNDWKQEQARREERQSDQGAAGNSDDEKTETDTVETSNVVVQFFNIFRMMWNFTSTEMVALFLSSMFYVHWIISLPLCTIFYNLVLRTAMRRYVLSTVTDEIFSYVEEKGMEMEIGVKEARYQASFMLAALREMREESREAKKKRKEVESSEKGDILGPLLGPLIKADKNSAPPPPDGFELPENLEFVCLEIDLPVGFYRLRWAFLHKDSIFVKEAVFRAESKYDNITFGEWNKHNDVIGCATLPDEITEKDILGAEKETSYLMPKSAFVGANMAAETNIIMAYNDFCFCIKKRCLTPDVPYGSTFVAWTQIVFVNTGNNSTRMVCSVEAEFPNGPPMVGRQIKSGMRSGVGDLFVLVGETIVKYSDEYP